MNARRDHLQRWSHSRRETGRASPSERRSACGVCVSFTTSSEKVCPGTCTIYGSVAYGYVSVFALPQTRYVLRMARSGRRARSRSRSRWLGRWRSRGGAGAYLGGRPPQGYRASAACRVMSRLSRSAIGLISVLTPNGSRVQLPRMTATQPSWG